MQKLLLGPDDDLLLVQMAHARREPIHSLKVGIGYYVECAHTIHSFFYPLMIASPHQAKRHNQPLFLPLTPENFESRYQVRLFTRFCGPVSSGLLTALLHAMVKAIAFISPTCVGPKTLLKPTVIELKATLEGIRAIAEIAFQDVASYFLPGKVRSDAIMVSMRSKRLYVVSFENCSILLAACHGCSSVQRLQCNKSS